MLIRLDQISVEVFAVWITSPLDTESSRANKPVYIMKMIFSIELFWKNILYFDALACFLMIQMRIRQSWFKQYKQQTLTWTNDDAVSWHKNASPYLP